MALTRKDSFSFEAIGTAWQVDCYGLPHGRSAADIRSAVLGRIATFDLAYSRFRSDSLVSQMARQEGEYVLPDDAKPLLDLYERLYRLTAGKVSPLIGQVLVDAGYDAEYSLVAKDHILPAPLWDECLSYDGRVLTIKRPVLIDVGAAGKGYLIDIISRLLHDLGVTKHCIDAGGDILIRGLFDAPIRIGLEHPTDDTQAIGVVTMGDGSICASATNRRAWGSYHHIMDPHTARPVQSVAATWVIAPSAMIADGLATALFFTKPKTLQQEFTFEYLQVMQDSSFLASDGFEAEIFTESQG